MEVATETAAPVETAAPMEVEPAAEPAVETAVEPALTIATDQVLHRSGRVVCGGRPGPFGTNPGLLGPIVYPLKDSQVSCR